MSDFVNVQVADGVATIRLDRPPMNAISVQVQAELREAAATVSSTPAIRAAVLYGGEKVFAAGADVKEMADKDYVAKWLWSARRCTRRSPRSPRSPSRSSRR